MSDTLPVQLNKRELHSLEVPASFETADSFALAVRNHGEAGRIHVHLDDGLSEVAAVEATNYYVRANDTAEIPVAVQGSGPVHGKIKLVSGYGAVTRWIDVHITESDDDRTVEVGADLGKPQPDPEPNGGAGNPAAILADRPALPVVVLGALALVVALVAAITVPNPAVTVGAVAVVAAVLVAGGLLVR